MNRSCELLLAEKDLTKVSYPSCRDVVLWNSLSQWIRISDSGPEGVRMLRGERPTEKTVWLGAADSL